MANTTLLKTVILQKKERKECGYTWIYAILPYDKRVTFDHTKYELVPEPSVIKRFYQGTISPLTVIMNLKRNPNYQEKIYLLSLDQINTKYIIMGNGSNFASVRIKTTDFYKYIINTENILITNFIE